MFYDYTDEQQQQVINAMSKAEREQVARAYAEANRYETPQPLNDLPDLFETPAALFDVLRHAGYINFNDDYFMCDGYNYIKTICVDEFDEWIDDMITSASGYDFAEYFAEYIDKYLTIEDQDDDENEE